MLFGVLSKRNEKKLIENGLNLHVLLVRYALLKTKAIKHMERFFYMITIKTNGKEELYKLS